MNVNPRTVEYNSTEKLVYMVAFIDRITSLPTKSDDLPDLKRGYDFEVGSIIIETSTFKAYMCNGDGTWTAKGA